MQCNDGYFTSNMNLLQCPLWFKMKNIQNMSKLAVPALPQTSLVSGPFVTIHLNKNMRRPVRGLCSSAGCWTGKCCGWLRSPLLRSLVLIWGLCEILKQSWEDVAGDKKQHIAATLGTSVLFFVNSVCQCCSSITLIWWHFFTWFPFPQFPGSTSK